MSGGVCMYHTVHGREGGSAVGIGGGIRGELVRFGHGRAAAALGSLGLARRILEAQPCCRRPSHAHCDKGNGKREEGFSGFMRRQLADGGLAPPSGLI